MNVCIYIISQQPCICSKKFYAHSSPTDATRLHKRVVVQDQVVEDSLHYRVVEQDQTVEVIGCVDVKGWYRNTSTTYQLIYFLGSN